MAARLDPSRWILGMVLCSFGVALGGLAGYDPQLAIAAALAAAFVLLILADLTVGVLIFTVLSFLSLLPAFAGPALSLPKLAGLLLGISWLAAIATRGEAGGDLFSEHPGITASLVLFLAWAGLSVVWAESHHDVWVAVSRYGLNLALIPIVYAALRRREHALWFGAAFVVGATIAAGYGLVTRPSASAGAGAGELDRISGTIGDPNELAAVLVAGIILAAALFRAYRGSPLVRLLLAGTAALCLATIFLTLSRGGLLALGAALVAGVIFGGRWRATFGLVAALAVLSGFVYFGAIASPQDRERLTAADGGTGRTDIWKVGWRMVDANPVIGVGAGNFQTSSIHYVIEPGTLKRSDFLLTRPEVTHNLYLHILAELGVVGLVLFLALIVGSLTAGMKAARRFSRHGEDALELLSRAMVVALLGVLAADFFLSGQYSKQLWLLIAFGPALYGLSRRVPAGLPARTESAVESPMAPRQPAQPLEAG